MSGLTEFLLAQIAKDEAIARAATGDLGWRVSLHNRAEVWADRDPAGYDAFLVATTSTRLNPKLHERDMADVDHIVRHDPARVLAECKAKRRLVALGVVTVNRLLALPDQNHPDYLAEWRP